MRTTAQVRSDLQKRYPPSVDSYESDLVRLVAPDSTVTDHTVFESAGGGKTIRLNSKTESTDTANSLIGFQSKPRRGVSAATDVIGCEISAQISDAIALTGSGSMIGAHVDVYLRGDEGDIAGDVRGQQIELVDDNDGSPGRTVAGNVNHLRFRTNLSCAVTGKTSCIRVENEEGSKSLDAFVQFVSTAGCVAALTAGSAGAATIKVLIDGTTWYIPLSASAS